MQGQKVVLIWLLSTVLAWAGCQSKKDGNQTTRPEASSSAAGQKEDEAARQKTILFFGNSITAGYGLEPSQAFPALIQEKLDSAQLRYKVVNAGLSGETSAGGKSRISWVLRQSVEVFVLELGANDGLRGIPLESTKQNLQAIIDTVRQKSPEAQIVLAGMEIPPNMGPEYTAQFRQMFKSLAKENNITLIPFLLEGVAGIPTLNQADGIHPTAEGHQIVARNVWDVLRPVLTDASPST